MKTKILILIVTSIQFMKAQDSIPNPIHTIETHSQIFSLSPISKKVDKVNGLVFGVGHCENKNIANQTINGMNVEINPAPIAGTFFAFLSLIYLPEIIKNRKPKDSINQHDFKIQNFNTLLHVKLNGINISSGCFFTTTNMNGLNLSLANKFKNFNGISITPLGTISDKMNGISIGIVNANNNLNGAIIGCYNQTYQLNGMQIGIVNKVEKNQGIQIGIYNRSFSRGFQLGFWNKNAKRCLPILNW